MEILESKAQVCFLPHWLPVGGSFNFYLRRGEGKNESSAGGDICREYLLLSHLHSMTVSPGDLGDLYLNTCFPASKSTGTNSGGRWLLVLAPRELFRAGGSFVILDRVGKAVVLFY